MVAKMSRYHQGFTLLEIMIVLFLLGFLATLIIVNMGRKPSVAQPMSSLMIVLSSALDSAEQEETLYGLVIGADGWQLVSYRKDPNVLQKVWQAIERPVILPKEVTLSLWIERHPITLSQDWVSDLTPQLRFYPGGETSIFTLSMNLADCTQTISASGFMEFVQTEVQCNEH